jgi:hypothetical protein
MLQSLCAAEIRRGVVRDLYLIFLTLRFEPGNHLSILLHQVRNARSPCHRDPSADGSSIGSLHADIRATRMSDRDDDHHVAFPNHLFAYHKSYYYKLIYVSGANFEGTVLYVQT